MLSPLLQNLKRETWGEHLTHLSNIHPLNQMSTHWFMFMHFIAISIYGRCFTVCLRGGKTLENRRSGLPTVKQFSVGKEEWNHFTSTALPLLLTISWRSAFVPLKAPCALTLQHSSAPTAEWVNSLCPRSRERSTATFPLEQLRPMFICSLLLSLTWSHQAHSVL